MRVLVAGGAGYVGSHTARALARRGHQVRIYDNLSTGHEFLAKGFELVVGDLADRTRLARSLEGVDAVMHFAAFINVGESVSKPAKYFDNNVGAGLTLLNTVVDAGTKLFVFSSSAAVYGNPTRTPIREEDSQQPTNPYGSSKLFFEQALQVCGHAHGLRWAALRYFNAAGADESGEIGELHEPETHLIPNALQVAASLRPELEVFGNDYSTPDGTCIRDYVHVTDLAEAHVLALEYLAKGGESVALNLGTSKGYSVAEVVRTVERVTGRKVGFRYGPRRPGDPPVLVADTAKARAILGWSPTRSLDQMVASAWMWLQSRARRPQEPDLPPKTTTAGLTDRELTGGTGHKG